MSEEKHNPFKDYVNSEEPYYTDREITFVDFLERMSGMPTFDLEEEIRKERKQSLVVLGVQVGVVLAIYVGVKILESKYG